MRIEAYLNRIGVEGPLSPDLETLRRVHRAHLLTIPYENLDVQFGRPLTTDPACAYAKLVEQGRGGWCYEMNGTLGWALGELGFKVTRLSAGNTRSGYRAPGRHLIIRVELEDGPWIADVGFGDGPVEPFALCSGDFEQEGFGFRIEAVDEPWTRVHNHVRGMSPCYDFIGDGPDEAELAAACHDLQTDPESPFVMNAVILRHTPGGRVSLIGRRLKRLSPLAAQISIIENADEYVTTLREVFGLHLPEAAGLWPRICARHEEIERAKAAAAKG